MLDLSPVSQQIWDMKYRFKRVDGQPVDKTVRDTWQRVARALAVCEKDPSHWEQKFFEVMNGFTILPAGRIIAGAGTKRDVTLFNCFVMGDIPDDMGGIFDGLKEAALTMQQGGGIGYNFSSLRPKGAVVKGVGADASGPLSFMDVWDAMCRTIMSAGSRRGAMMAVMRCDHPDIEAFIEAKREPGRLRMFNLSVLVTDAFMAAVKDDASWELNFSGTTFKSLSARELWDKIMRATFAYAEPGVIFIDRINARNNLNYCETINATNPCGEQPLPPYGACLLGSVNLARLVEEPFTDAAKLDLEVLDDLVLTAVRMLDNVIDVSNFPLEEQRHEAQSKRRIGLGITGLADALIMCGARYGGSRAVELTKTWLKCFRRSAYLASIDLAKEKGPFPMFERGKYLASETIQTLDTDVKDALSEHGIRNALLTSVAPTGTISLFADNVSSGLEPVFSFSYKRHVLMPDGTRKEEDVTDYAYRLYRSIKGACTPLTDAFVDAHDLSPHDHLVMQATVQNYIDSSISKTINVPEKIDFSDFKDIYSQAFELGCKGCTTYRPNDVTGAVLERKSEDEETSHEPELPLEPPSQSVKPADYGDAGSVTHLYKPLDRPGELGGRTYKLRWPDSDHAIYITLNDILDDTGRVRPFEIFINSKNTEHYAWTVALTRMISAVFRRGGDVSFVVEELKAVFDPRGGQWMRGKYVPSLLAAIGEIIEAHLISIGFLGAIDDLAGPKTVRAETRPPVMIRGGGIARHSNSKGERVDEAAAPFRQCPKCAQLSLIRQEGCDTCISCSYSKCG
ncbi:MAG: ribonucleoside-diphosphate reductase, adenosylcobalamin-dependent [Rhodospirillaceae bacterium TMED8]|nr:ribonucleoside-diphosphate reductase, adenosylcobalamin-dependent [Magnetovibrio sp.]OUT49872.1 MAG: ribonucleoside-diphosphate reductase, adenosylcobalamin-dependent [Rhodospirillaceae bacterium TMED8]|tara:strand:- start:1732 stop:4113 length:2382 start_codon:yes stop_codon:yes gene_type:complete